MNIRKHFGRAKEAITDGCGKVKETATNTVDKLTLNTPVRKIEEYCQKYTQVLLGIHADLGDTTERLRKLETQVQRYRVVAALSLLLAVAAIVVALTK